MHTINYTNALHDAARESDEFTVTDDGWVTLAPGVEEATLEVPDPRFE